MFIFKDLSCYITKRKYLCLDCWDLMKSFNILLLMNWIISMAEPLGNWHCDLVNNNFSCSSWSTLLHSLNSGTWSWFVLCLRNTKRSSHLVKINPPEKSFFSCITVKVLILYIWTKSAYLSSRKIILLAFQEELRFEYYLGKYSTQD